MRARSTPHAFAQLTPTEKVRIEAQVKQTKPGPLQDVLLRKLERASRMEKWVTSKGLQPPK